MFFSPLSYAINIVYLNLHCKSPLGFLFRLLVRRVQLTQFCTWIRLANRLSNTWLIYSVYNLLSRQFTSKYDWQEKS